MNDPELTTAGAAMRAEWRTDEEEWTRAAFERWQHGRTVLDVARASMHRGDTVGMILPGWRVEGVVTSVGEDILQVTTAAGDGGITVHVDADVPLALRVVRRATSGGVRGDRELVTLRALVFALEAAGTVVQVGTAATPDALTGTLSVGRDQIAVRDRDGIETYVPTRWVTWVRMPLG